MLKKTTKDEFQDIKKILNNNIISSLNYYIQNEEKLIQLLNNLELLNNQELFNAYIILKKIKNINILDVLPIYLKDSLQATIINQNI